jgi:hypothetical protein
MDAVVKGAVLRRVQQQRLDNVEMTACSRSYGILMNRKWSSFLHERRDYLQDPWDGKNKAKNQIEWMLRKGDLLLAGERQVETHFNRKFRMKSDTVRQLRLVLYDGDDAPGALADLPSSTYLNLKEGDRPKSTNITQNLSGRRL